MPDTGVALEQAERVFDGIDQTPVEAEQFNPRAPRQDDAGQGSAGGAALGELTAKILESHGFVP